MSWLAKSIVNSLTGQDSDDDDDDESNHITNPESQSSRQPPIDGHDEDSEDPTRGVKDDISELTQTLTRQFWGFASFLAPPPSDPSDPTVADDPTAGIRSDLAEISGRFRSGISLLSSAKAVSEISKIASSFLPFGDEVEEEEEGEGEVVKYEGNAVGVSDEVLVFARNVAMHRETWLDFPLIADEDDSDDLDMSDAQLEHALAVEQHAPRLAALRMDLCPSHMSEGRFWKIYFVILHSRLGRKDAELLMTPQILQAREMLLQDLHNRKKQESEASGGDTTVLPEESDTLISSEESIISPLATSTESSTNKTLMMEEPLPSIPITDHETEKHPVETTSGSITDLETEKHPVEATEVKIIDKSVIEENPPDHSKIKDLNSNASDSISIQKYEEDGDDWLKDGVADEASGSGGAPAPVENEEDVSFSDLEEDYEQGTSNNSKTRKNLADSAELLDKEANDWLNIEDIDEE